MVEVKVEKIYRYERIAEHLSFCLPLREGQLFDTDGVYIFDGRIQLPIQVKVTSRYKDGSIRFLFIRFYGDIPANRGKSFQLYVDEDIPFDVERGESSPRVIISEKNDTIMVDTGKITFSVESYLDRLFSSIDYEGRRYLSEDLKGPILVNRNDEEYGLQLSKWQIVESGPLCTVLKVRGNNVFGNGGCEEGEYIAFEVKITAWAESSALEISYRLINTTDRDLHIKSLIFTAFMKDLIYDPSLEVYVDEHNDSTGCGDINIVLDSSVKNVYHTIGIADLAEIERRTPAEDIRTCAGMSNYRTDFYIGRNGNSVCRLADSKKLLKEGNEHFTEVFYGAFFADRTDEMSGLSASIYQAQQNYPKAVKADENAVYVMLVPECEDRVVMPSGTSREQIFMLDFHEKELPLREIDNRALIYQMPYRPFVDPEVYRDSGAVTDVFCNDFDLEFEQALIDRADGHMRSYGMMHFGDTADMHYTNQGRGGGSIVWSNNEYDYPHACALMYARSGIRRFMDYNIAHARHWMDVDVCHYSQDRSRIGGQIEHTSGHVRDGVQVPSHEWCEGLLDYYHLTGDERGLETAIGIGDNVLGLLEKPEYQKAGEANARETGWALRLLTALYIETSDEKWLRRCDSIVEHFRQWYGEYGCFSAQYTDNTLVHTGFMIAVAAGSLMRYYRVQPSEALKELIMNAVDDIYDNCILDNGLFYYKELPSLMRNGSNNLLLEAMAIGYELTGDKKYIEAGYQTYVRSIKGSGRNYGDTKRLVDGVLLTNGGGTKDFAQSFYPLTVYHKFYQESSR